MIEKALYNQSECWKSLSMSISAEVVFTLGLKRFIRFRATLHCQEKLFQSTTQKYKPL